MLRRDAFDSALGKRRGRRNWTNDRAGLLRLRATGIADSS